MIIFDCIDVGTVASMQWYSSFEEARVKILQQNGKKAAIGSFSAGLNKRQ